MKNRVKQRVSSAAADRAIARLMRFAVEVPSWGFADTGTRFGKFFQDAAAVDMDDKLADAGACHRYTGITPTVAVHVLWDFPNGFDGAVVRTARKHGVRIGSINPNVFQDQCYKFGSLTNRDPAVRKQALKHILDSIEIGSCAHSRFLSLWFADGMNYPGQGDIRQRKNWLAEGLKRVHAATPASMRMLVEYKPFEPAGYATDIFDWGASYLLCRESGKRAKVLVDLGHHLPGCNIEQIVAWLLDEEMLGGFHFNDRKYADDDLNAGSIDPYQLFRIFNEIAGYEAQTGKDVDIAWMIDQSHNIKPKVQAMIQSVCTIQMLLAKALLVDRKALAAAQAREDVTAAQTILHEAFYADVTSLLKTVRKIMGAPADPLEAFRKSGYELSAAKARRQKRADLGIVRGGAYA